jgi:multidrug efflux pump subunit AcrB
MLTSFAVKRWQLTVVLLFGLFCLGVQSLAAIPKAEDPTFPLPTFAVVAVLPGATPADLERLVVDPLEARLDRLDDVKHVKTEISDSLAVLQVEFSRGSTPTRSTTPSCARPTARAQSCRALSPRSTYAASTPRTSPSSRSRS